MRQPGRESAGGRIWGTQVKEEDGKSAGGCRGTRKGGCGER